MTYAVVVSADDGPELAGQLQLSPEEVRFADGTRIRYSDLTDIYVERKPRGSMASGPVLVLISRQGQRRRISSLEGLGALHELAGELFEAREKPAA